jgi:hypothetical protein
MGKSGLLRELRPVFDRHGLVLFGRCYEGATTAYLPFVETLRSCLERRPHTIDQLGPGEEGRASNNDGRGAEPHGASSVYCGNTAIATHLHGEWKPPVMPV